MSHRGMDSTTSHVTLLAPNRDVKNKITLLPRFLTLPFNLNLPPKERNYENSRCVRYGLRSKKWHRCAKSRHHGVTRSLHRKLVVMPIPCLFASPVLLILSNAAWPLGQRRRKGWFAEASDVPNFDCCVKKTESGPSLRVGREL
jgi:hypothetical protein